ncbi:hypothetical protein PIB30_000308 [Stylosanthes scabra]|uniref:Uncharacterized protein n=1 Tax=Stylosanthes scabra TaxID=79078 RepID=A0ABU6T212_9FABA|nr:hypothetical protein [Stylosanthes scabra]
MSGRGKGSSQSSRSRGRGRGRSTPSSEPTATASPSTSTPGVSQVAPTIPPPPAPSTQSPPTDPPQVDPSSQLHADSSHVSQPDPPTQQVEQIPIIWDGQKGFNPDNNVCTQAISDVIELMLNEPCLNYSEVPADVQKRWCINLQEGFTWPQEEDKQIKKSFNYRAGKRYQQIKRDLRSGELQRLKWLSETLRGRLMHRFATDPGFLKRSGVCKVNRASPKGGCLHTRGSATIPKTRAWMTRSLDRPPTEPETEFSTNIEQATQQAQEEGDETAGTRQTLSEPCKNRVYGAGGFFASSLDRSGYGGSSAFATCSQAGPADAEVVDLREQVQNLTHSLQTQWEALQQQIDEVRSLRETLADKAAQADEVRSLKETLAERDARAKEQLQRLEEMQHQMAAYYDPLRPASSITARGGSGGSSTAPPLPPCPPPPAQPDQGPVDDDDDYEDA